MFAGPNGSGKSTLIQEVKKNYNVGIFINADEIEARQTVAQRYTDGIADALITPAVSNKCRSVWAQYTVRTRPNQSREEIMAALGTQGVPTVVYYPRPLHLQTAYRNFPTDPSGLPVAEALASQVFSLPMHPYLDAGTQEQIIEAIKIAVG